MLRTLISALLLACLVAGCAKGSLAEQESRPTATPPAAAITPEGIDVQAISRARTAFAAACKKRAGGDPSLTDLRSATADMIAAFKANPDTPFAFSERLPKASMRQRLRALGLAARTSCGGGGAIKIGERIVRVATRDAP